MVGFPYYNEIPVVAPPTLGDLIDSLTGQQKGAILNGYTIGTKEVTLARRILVPESTVFALYEAIKGMVNKSNALMQGEVEITPAVKDPETGEITKPAVMNAPPVSAAALLAEVQDDYSEWFSKTEVTAILTRMVEYSKYSGNGTWEYYAQEVVK
jgi:hypothetical protein